MTPIQWLAFVVLPAALAIVAIIGVRVFERLHPVPVAPAPSPEPDNAKHARQAAAR
jgi:hypothetical protein